MKVLKALFLMWYKNLIKDSLKMLINIIRQFLVNGYWKNFRPDTGYRKKTDIRTIPTQPGSEALAI